MKKLLQLLFGRLTIVATLLLFQIGVLLAFFWRLEQYFVYFYAFMTVLGLVMVVWIAGRRMNAAFKLSWVILMLVFPLVGVPFYLMFGTDPTKGRFIKRLHRYREKVQRIFTQDPAVTAELSALDRSVAAQAHYLIENTGYPCCTGTETTYLPTGERMFHQLLEELKAARHYIFILSFIIQPGIMWDSIHDILRQKVAEGVDVRVIYDDVGCIRTVPYFFKNQLEQDGIRCGVFNPVRPILSVRLNNRDHRKMIVIDGITGFTGGINLADEYINQRLLYGHWKDAAVLLRGRAVTSLTTIFLETWGFLHPGESIAFGDYMPNEFQNPREDDGYVLPFADIPVDDEPAGEMAYLNIIARATEYVYITTPYLIVGDELITSLELAAKSGVDVRIITPHIPDKWYVHLLTRASYHTLIRSGVKIYEYTPGFIHSKTFVSDDKVGVVGTINLDFRSFYHHFECAAWMAGSSALMDIRDDFLETLSSCKEISLKESNTASIPQRMLRGILRLFSPLF